jgi:hypothetical protein
MLLLLLLLLLLLQPLPTFLHWSAAPANLS